MAPMCWLGYLDTCSRLSGVGNQTPHKMWWLLWTLTSSSLMYWLDGRAQHVMPSSLLMPLREMMGSLCLKVTETNCPLHLCPYHVIDITKSIFGALIGKFYLVDVGYACRSGFVPPYRGWGTICLSMTAETTQPMQGNCSTWDTPHLGSQYRGILGLWRTCFVF